MKLIKPLLFFGLLSVLSVGSVFAQAVGSVAGSVTDGLGAVVVGATVTAVSATGAQKQSITNAKGDYSITGLAPGKYTVKAIAPQFELYENTEVEITAGEKNELVVILTVGGIAENVEVSENEQISLDPANNSDATVLRGSDLDALPDDPDELQAALQALVGAAGPNGGQIYIDGFTGGQLPPKESIREIRINSNPFSAEYERPGTGRIEILTKPGSDKFRGTLQGSFNDESLNSRNPFALNRAPTQQRTYGGNISGPIQKGRSSYFIDVQNRDIDNNAIINALVLDPSLNIVDFRRDVQVPTKNFRFGPRVDFAINDKNTLVARYNFSRNTRDNQGLGDTSLLSRAFESSSRDHEIRITETMIINAKTVNETRFEYSDDRSEQNGDNSVPTINVSSAFTGGGASIGRSFDQERSWELNNITNTSFGRDLQHTIKFGVKVENDNITDRSENNYAGTFFFPGFFAPSDACDLDGDLVISPIEQFRCNVIGVADPRFNPTQFTITTGNPLIGVSQYDYGLFISDDWKARPDLLVSAGLRYENQSNISSNSNFAPRLGIAWSPGAGGARRPSFVIRGGAGIFYERFGVNNTLQALRFNGENQLSLLVSANDPDPARRATAIALLSQPVFTVDGVTNTPTASQILAVLPQSNSIRDVSPTLQAPYTFQAVFSVERALNSKMTLTGTYVAARSFHQIRIRNINAPICPPLQATCVGAPRPDPSSGNINAYESSGVLNQNRLNLNLRTNLSRKFSLNVNYSLGFVNGNTDTPAYSYDLSTEYGRASFDTRHNLFVVGNFTMPWGITLTSFITARSGNPFNITRGVDANGDGFFTDRPTFGQLQTRCGELNLTASFCDIGGSDPGSIIPRNYGQGPSSFSVRLSAGKNFGFGKSAGRLADTGGDSGRGGGGGRGFGGFGGGRGGGGFGGGGDGRKPYNLNISISANNLFNNVNLGQPVGSLSSFRFGQSISTGGGFGGFGGGGFGGGTSGQNRKVDLNMRFSW